jgi:signal transduction histidine kinase
MPLTFERKLPIALLIVLIVLTMLGVALYQHTMTVQDTLGIGKHSQIVLSRLDEVQTLVLEIDSGMRGFVITGNDTYLEPYNRAKQRIDPAMAELKAMTADHPEQIDELDRLNDAIDEYVAEATRKVDIRKSGGYEAAIYQVVSQRDKTQADNIRASIDRVKTAELDLMQQSDRKLDQSFYRTIWILLIGSLAGIFALGVANYLVSSEFNKRRRAERALIEANRGLEEKVEQRTAELRSANESLETRNAERELLLENEKAARREAEIANRLRDEFIATVSHELRTPINSILGWARMMKSGALDQAKSTKGLETIIRNSETQHRLIEDLMDVSRLISGKLELDKEQLDPTDLIETAVESINPSAAAKKISLRSDIDKELHDRTIDGDRNRLMQVFTNLLTNAVKFTPDGGSVDVFASASGNCFEVKVVDTGIGISEEFLSQVFERFRQDSSTHRSNGGLGLGLAIVRNLVEMHGGEVGVVSEGKGKGATFTVRIPFAKAEQQLG